MEQKLIYCCICNGPIDWHTTPEGEVYWTQGHNAEPVKEGRCCTVCNNNEVLPKRLRAHRSRQTMMEGRQI